MRIHGYWVTVFLFGIHVPNLACRVWCAGPPCAPSFVTTKDAWKGGDSNSVCSNNRGVILCSNKIHRLDP